MPSFDVVSEVDMQEVRNAVDQAARELANRYDFKGTDSTIELGESEIKMATSSEDRLIALRTLLEENRQLRAELEGLRGQVARMERVEREVMTLVKASSREKIVHDLRNVLNELVLLRAIAGDEDFK